MVHVIAHRLDVHHRIFQCLKSSHHYEMEAAIFALNEVCAVSSLFAKGLLGKLSSMIRIDGAATSSPSSSSTSALSSTPLCYQHQLIRLFRYMSHDTHTIAEAHAFCRSVIAAGAAATDMTLEILEATTALTESTRLYVAEQIALLCTYAIDTRPCISYAAIIHLTALYTATSGLHHIHLSSLASLLKSSSSTTPSYDIVIVMLTLLLCVASSQKSSNMSSSVASSALSSSSSSSSSDDISQWLAIVPLCLPYIQPNSSPSIVVATNTQRVITLATRLLQTLHSLATRCLNEQSTSSSQRHAQQLRDLCAPVLSFK
jgi:hypothetical protein